MYYCHERVAHRAILLNQTEIRLHLQFPDLFGTANGHCHIATRVAVMWNGFFGGHQQRCNIDDTFRLVIGILEMRHISTGILTKISQTIVVKIPVKMSQFTGIPQTRLNV